MDGGGVQSSGIDPALDQVDTLPLAADHEIHFVVRLVQPIENVLVPIPKAQGVQHQVFP